MSREAILDEWLAATLATYPAQTARVLRELHDPFRNPVGHTLREGLRAVLDALLDAGDFALKPILGAGFEERVDRAALAAFDVFMECRETLYQAKANEARRRYGALERTGRTS